VGAGASSAASAVESFAAAFFQELARAGVEHVCISPGSRSTPLAVAAFRAAGLRCTSHIDERSAGFFALGLARASRHPVALVCTSGTAAANYLPAVVEAHYARVPLILLTADRPPELRECGAGQTIDQLGLYGRHVRRFFEVPVALPGPEMQRFARALGARAVAESCGREAGPVHLNWPLREPLEPGGDGETLPITGEPLADDGRHGLPYTSQVLGQCRASEGELRQLVDRIRRHERGVIACGALAPDDERSSAIAALARRVGWPILADPLSQLRRGPHSKGAPVIAHADLLLRNADFAEAHRPDVVLRIGGPPVSKAQRLWLEAAPPEALLLLDPGGGWDDPSHLVSRVLRLDAAPLCRDLVAAIGGDDRRSAWCESFVEADGRVAAAIARAMNEEDALLEPRAVHELAPLLPDDALLHVSNSMPVRDLDAFMPAGERPLRVYCNRGANGIDGVLSSALGAAASGRGRVVLLIGDVALLHDLGGLLAARRQALDISVVLLNNDGGGIFSFLPIAEHGESVGFETFFSTPHGVDFEPAAALFGLQHQRVRSWEEYRRALTESFERPGVSLIELEIDRDANLKHFRQLVQRAGEAAG